MKLNIYIYYYYPKIFFVIYFIILSSISNFYSSYSLCDEISTNIINDETLDQKPSETQYISYILLGIGGMLCLGVVYYVSCIYVPELDFFNMFNNFNDNVSVYSSDSSTNSLVNSDLSTRHLPGSEVNSNAYKLLLSENSELKNEIKNLELLNDILTSENKKLNAANFVLRNENKSLKDTIEIN